MKGNILSYNKQVCDRNWRVNATGDSFHRIYYVYNGEATYREEASLLQLKSRHIYIFPCNHEYTMVHNPEKPLEVMWFHLDYPVPLVEKVLEISIEKNTVEEYLIHALEVTQQEEQEVIEKIFEALIIRLQQVYPMKKDYVAFIATIVEYIDTHLIKEITNEELAHLVGYNKNYMIKKFKTYVGLSPRQYIIKTKMNYAKKYLTNGKSVKETARLLGYSDPNVLSRDFKHYYNQNPSYHIGNKIP
ncbi:MAG: helix-turn-helix transcriptional regulator [Cellulosilyticaceae bacterium]